MNPHDADACRVAALGKAIRVLAPGAGEAGCM